MAKLEVGQWYAAPGQADWRRCQILEFVDMYSLRYLDCYADGTIEKRLTSSHQWAFDVRRGELELTERPDESWLKGGTDGKSKDEGRQGRKGAGLSKRGRR